MPDNATILLKGDDRHLKSTLKKSEGTIRSFGSTVKKIMLALGVAVAAKKLFSAFGKFFNLFEEQERAETKVAAVIKATGMAAGFTADQMKQMASDMQEVTTIGDEVILSAQAIILTFKNIKGDEFVRTTKAAADMAEVMGTDLASAATQLSKALNDPATGMNMLTRVGVKFTQSQKDAAKALQETGDIAGAQGIILAELESQFGGAAEAVANTFSGRMIQRKNQLGDIGEKLFEALIPAFEALSPIIDGAINLLGKLPPILSQIIEWFVTVGPEIREKFEPFMDWWREVVVARFTVVQMLVETLWKTFKTGFGIITDVLGSWFKDTGPFFKGVVDAILDVINNGILMLAFEIENLGDIIFMWYTATALVFVKFGALVKHVFMGVVKLIVWLGENFENLFNDMLNFQMSVFTNMFTNIVNFTKSVKNYLQGKSWDFQWTGLLDGFKSTLTELPDLLTREKGPLEARLEGDLDDIVDRLRRRWKEKQEEFKKRTGQNLDMANNFGADVGAGAGKPPLDDPGLLADLGLDEFGKPLDDRSFKAAFVGLEEMNRKITISAAGISKEDKVQNAVVQQGQAQVVAVKEVKKATEDVEKAVKATLKVDYDLLEKMSQQSALLEHAGALV